MTDVAAIAVGTELGDFSRDTGFANWNRYAAVNNEFIPIHMDDEAGRAAGYPTAFGMGNLTFAYLHNALRQWFGPEVTIEEVAVQFRSAITRGNELSVSAVVTAVDDDPTGRRIALDVLAGDRDGARIAVGTAAVRLSR
jgi:acyl dehydratase